MDNALPSTPETDPAALAFAQLGEKIDLLEAAVIGLAAKRDAAPDYSDTLTEVADLLERMRTAINDFARAPAMQFTPEAMAVEIVAGGTKARAADAAALEKARVRLDNAAHRIEQLAGTVTTVREQRRRLLWAAGGSLLAGMLLWSFLPGVILRAFPQSWHMPENMARHIIGEPTLWDAGGRLMQAGNADRWNEIVDADIMRRENLEIITKCERTAAKKKGSVPCAIKVDFPDTNGE
ncbi:MAG TPA: DUF6118 family protein [Sphingopyxis sp.]|nr:DUF6118 family protein [Sphingopyxis sp.]